MPAKPNFLLIMADQMAGPAMPFHGNPTVKAPAMARMATEGVVSNEGKAEYVIAIGHMTPPSTC